jgi:hypothetical protein
MNDAKGPIFDRLSGVSRAAKEIVSSIYTMAMAGSVAFACLYALGEFRTVGWICAAVTAVGLAFHLEDSIYGKRYFESLSGYRYRLDDGELLKVDLDGSVVARIDLEGEFVVDIPYRGQGRGIVRVRQNRETLEMPSTADGAEQIARSVLGIRQWPPDSIGTLPF